jgi:hypothetical protein
MKKRNHIVMMLLVIAALLTAGCEGSELARDTALRLRDAVVEDEQVVDSYIGTQTDYYKKQQATIAAARENNGGFKLDAHRRKRSAEAATKMSLDPDNEVRLATVLNYLQDTHDQELAVWQEYQDADQLAREELKSKIAKLERQKKLLQEVKNNLAQLAMSPSSKKRSLFLLAYAQETYAAFLKSKAQ